MATPTGYSQQAALQKVRRLADEQSLPVDADVIGFLNDALEQLCADLNPLRYVENVAVVGGAVKISLPADMYTIDRLTWSNALPTAIGVQEYPLTQLDPGAFDDLSGGMPVLNGGTPGWYRLLSDESNAQTIQCYVAIPTNGYVNVYGAQRPALWDPADPTSTTNLDSSLQLLAVYMAVYMVCENRENLEKAKYYRQIVYGADGESGMYGQAAQRLSRRQRAHGARVRDVMGGPSYAPVWMKDY